jgi:hypothetical protein
LLLYLVIGTTVWVNMDARNRRWTGCKLATDRIGWTLGCLLLWIVFFPAYLAVRADHPRV